MAATIAVVAGLPDHVEGNKKVRVRLITFDSSYPTGGYSITPAQLGMKTVETCDVGVAPATSGGATARSVAYDYTNQKMQVYSTASAEVSASSDQSAFSVRARFVGV